MIKAQHKRSAKLNDIKVWYKFRPNLSVWFSKTKGQSYITKRYEESWYGGYWFRAGYFGFIQCKYFAVHILFKWWKIRL